MQMEINWSFLYNHQKQKYISGHNFHSLFTNEMTITAVVMIPIYNIHLVFIRQPRVYWEFGILPNSLTSQQR